jgi:ParB family transcriptional regulator, chromosome partitioning protein
VFRAWVSRRSAHLDPFYWRDDYVAVEQWSRNIIRDHYVCLVQLHEQHVRFAATWDTTAVRVLKAIGDAVPVRLMKRDLLFVLMQTFPLLGEWQLQTLARRHGIRKDRETDMLDKLLAPFLRRADEGTLSRLLVEVSIVLASGRSNGTSALRDAAAVYKVDTDAIALKVKQDFAAKERGRSNASSVTKALPQRAKKSD